MTWGRCGRRGQIVGLTSLKRKRFSLVTVVECVIRLLMYASGLSGTASWVLRCVSQRSVRETEPPQMSWKQGTESRNWSLHRRRVKRKFRRWASATWGKSELLRTRERPCMAAWQSRATKGKLVERSVVLLAQQQPRSYGTLPLWVCSQASGAEPQLLQ